MLVIKKKKKAMQNNLATYIPYSFFSGIHRRYS